MCAWLADTRFTRPTDEQINATLTEATRRVNAAVNRTRQDLRTARTAEHLLRFVRYPPSHALNLAQSAEIFEQTMEALLADVNAGHAYNIDDTGQYSLLIYIVPHTHTCRYTAFLLGTPGLAGALTKDRLSRTTTVFLRARCPTSHSTYSVKHYKKTQWFDRLLFYR